MARQKPEIATTGLAAAAAAIGAATNPMGAAIGVVGASLVDRWLGPAEARRVGFVVERAGHLLVELEAEGRSPRQDGFFDEVDDRSSATEIVEGVLVACKGSYEERKLEHLAALLARLAFEPAIGPTQAAHLVRSADRLSFDQFRLLEVFSRRTELGLATTPLRGQPPIAAPVFTLLADAWELYGFGYLRSEKGGFWLTARELVPRLTEPVATGLVLRHMLDLASIADGDLETIAGGLRW